MIDGHFWVERDGEIIDPTFSKDDEYIRRINRTTTKKAYHEAPELVQKILITMMEKTASFELKKLKLMEGLGSAIVNIQELNKPMTEEEMTEAIKNYIPRFNCCNTNAYTEAKLRGGRIVFGSQGWVKKDGSGVWWEYGNTTWNTVAQFIKK